MYPPLGPAGPARSGGARRTGPGPAGWYLFELFCIFVYILIYVVCIVFFMFFLSFMGRGRRPRLCWCLIKTQQHHMRQHYLLILASCLGRPFLVLVPIWVVSICIENEIPIDNLKRCAAWVNT